MAKGKGKVDRDLNRRFAEFHLANPQVYTELVALAREASRRGRKRIGIKMIYEVVRWNRFIQTTDDSFKLNNDYHSRYARLIMQREVDLAGIFETRSLL
ncbi:MAG: hypothetical protein WC222_12505 [Parachlamydiales bacterium]|jgi:hypothetical protein